MIDQDSLKIITICKFCNEQYEDPVILPCGKSVCSKHVKNDKSTENDSVFKCFLCGKKHPIPTDGFSKNEDLNQLLLISDDYVNINGTLGKKNKKAIELCDKLEELIKKSETLINDPSLYIYDYFSQIKSDLDLNREQCIQMINDNYYRILKELEEQEKKCMNNINIIDSSIKSLNESITSSKETLAASLRSSKRPDLNDEYYWSNFKLKIQKEISRSDYTINKLQSELLSSQSFEFKLNSVLNENNFGNLITTNDHFPSEDRLEGTINFEIDEFKSFKSQKLDQYDRDWCVIDNIRWTASVQITEDDSYTQYIGLFVEPDCEVLESPINGNFDLKLLKSNGEIFIIESFKHTFEDTIENGYTLFCCLRDIFDLNNEIYDNENDSIKMQIDIKILK